MKRKDFLATLPALGLLFTVKSKPKQLTIPPADAAFLGVTPHKLATYERATFNNLKEKQEEFIWDLKHRFVTSSQSPASWPFESSSPYCGIANETQI